MSTSTLSTGTRKAPYVSELAPAVARRIAATEYDRVVATFERLAPDDWGRPTDCTDWDVRAMAGHMVGMAQMASSLRETMRQQLASKRRVRRDGGATVDAMTALQVEEHAGLDTSVLLERLRAHAPRAVRFRFGVPALMRNRPIEPQTVGGVQEYWTLDYMLGTILTRDPFMHRIDIARATGVLVPPTAEHEGVIVDDVVREWAGRHGVACSLELTGPAGGRWEFGEGGEQITEDALEFCRAISGRRSAPGLLATEVPF